jgi:4-azaleucine resistance transporter AzlC
MSEFSSYFWLGARRFIPVAISIAAYGLVWGMLAGQAGMSLIEVIAMSGLVYAGASQFVVLDLWEPGQIPVVSIIITAAIVNLRIVMMSASFRPVVGHLRPLPAYASMFLMSDEPWAMTMGEKLTGPKGFAFFLGTGFMCWSSWFVSTVIGRLAGGFLRNPEQFGLDFAFTATFLVLLLGMVKGRGDLVPIAIGGLVAIATARLVPGNWYIIAGGLAGSLAGAIVETRKGRAHVA